MIDFIKKYKKLEEEQDNLTQEFLEFKAQYNENSRKRLLNQIRLLRYALNDLTVTVKNCLVKKEDN